MQLDPRFLNATIAIGYSDPAVTPNWLPNASAVFFARTLRRQNGLRGFELYLITNRHVFQADDGEDPVPTIHIGINYPDGNTTGFARIDVTRHREFAWWTPAPGIDLALMRVPSEPLVGNGMEPQFFWDQEHCTNLRQARNVHEGEGVFMIGYPMKLPQTNRLRPLVRSGIVSEIRSFYRRARKNTFLIDVPSFGGNSGGPVILKPSPYHIGDEVPPNELRLIGFATRKFDWYGENSGLTEVVPFDVIKLAITRHLERFGPSRQTEPSGE